MDYLLRQISGKICLTMAYFPSPAGLAASPFLNSSDKAHEIAEACTNPVDDKKAFVDPNPDDLDKNEIADFCACKSDTVNEVVVEGYWSNLDGCCIIPKDDGTQTTFELCPA